MSDIRRGVSESVNPILLKSFCLGLLALALTGCAARSIRPLHSAAPAPRKFLALIDGTNTCPIYVQTNTAAHGAALAGYLRQMSGREFKVATVTNSVIPEGKAVLVLTAAGKAAKCGGDGFTIKTGGDQLRITGSTPLAAGFAVFAFLEDQLGCRWWSCNEEDVPSNTVPRIRPLDLTVRSPFRQHDLYNLEAQTSQGGFNLKSRGLSTEQFTASHSLYGLLTPYAKERPEIYPMNKDGKRAPNDLHFCYLAPGIVDALCDALEREVVKRNGNVRDYIYFAGMGDWYGGMCECPECKKVYEEETWTAPDGKKYAGYSATLIRMMNAVGAKLEQKYPGIRVGTFAYMSLDAPPGITKPRPNVAIWMPHLRYCIGHSLEACEKNRTFLAKLQRWCKIAPGNVYIWDYVVNFGQNFMFPTPVVRSTAARIRTYAKLGCAGVYLQGNYVSTGSDLIVLKNYVWGRLLWNPGLDTDALVGEFCDGYYGPAAAAIKRYVLLLEDAAGKGGDFDEFADVGAMKKAFLPPETQRDLRAILGEALKAAGGQQPYVRRVKEAAASLEAFDMTANAPAPVYAPKDGYLALSGVVTFPRADEMLRHSRDATFREWGGFQGYHEGFLRWQGGPLPRFKQGPVEVDVAVAQAGRIYQITFNGKPLLHPQHPNTNPQEAYRIPVLFRGSFENLTVSPSSQKPACYAFLRETERQPNSITMEGDADVASWHTTEFRIRKTIDFRNDGTIRVMGQSLRKSGRGKVAEQVTTVTDYLVATNAAFTVETSADGTTWARVSLDAFVGTTASNSAAATAQRLTCSVQGPAKAVRIGLPASGAVVEDDYGGLPVESVKLVWDKGAGVLTTEVMTARDPDGNWPVREIKVLNERK